MPLPDNTMLTVSDLEVYYGGIHALHGVNLHVEPGEIVSVIGANGAGKSTLMNTIAGVKHYRSGQITLQNELLPNESYLVVKSGVMLVPEGRRIFAGLSVRDNLRLGAYTRTDHAEIQATMDEVFELFPVLGQRANQSGGTLSGGEQQMLALGRALMSHPRVLLLDEPSLGLAPLIIDLLFDTILKLNEETGLTILLVEQNATLALEISNRAYVLKTGEIIMEGTGQDLLADDRVRQSYLGVSG